MNGSARFVTQVQKFCIRYLSKRVWGLARPALNRRRCICKPRYRSDGWRDIAQHPTIDQDVKTLDWAQAGTDLRALTGYTPRDISEGIGYFDEWPPDGVEGAPIIFSSFSTY
jgi:hypothetical protein